MVWEVSHLMVKEAERTEGHQCQYLLLRGHIGLTCFPWVLLHEGSATSHEHPRLGMQLPTPGFLGNTSDPKSSKDVLVRILLL